MQTTCEKTVDVDIPVSRAALPSRTRVAWLDAARGVTIIAVVMYHSPMAADVKHYLSTFIMPMFFLLSGWVFALRRHDDFGAFLKSRVRTLLVPYFAFALILYAFYGFVLRDYGMTNISGHIAFLGQLLYGSHQSLPDIVKVFWFLSCLFVTQIGFFWAAKYLKPRNIALVLAGSSAAGFLMGAGLARGYWSFRLPWCIDIAFTAVVFYGVGYLLARKVPAIMPVKPSTQLIALAVALAASIGFFALNGPASMPAMEYGNYAWFYAAAFAGMAAFAVMGGIAGNSRVLSYLGRNSLIILCFHLIAFRFVSIFLAHAFHVNIGGAKNSAPWGIVYTLGALLLLLPGIYVINRYFPFLLGRKKQA